MNRILTAIVAFLLLAAVGAVTWLHAQPGPQVGSLVATPSYVVVNTPTQVTFTIDLSSLASAPTRVNLLTTDAAGNQILATAPLLHDDGLNGDATAGDHVFSHRLGVSQQAIGQLYYRAAMYFAGVAGRTLTGVATIHVGASLELLTVTPTTIAASSPATVLVSWRASEPQSTSGVDIVD